jgi:hypothetical protein
VEGKREFKGDSRGVQDGVHKVSCFINSLLCLISMTSEYRMRKDMRLALLHSKKAIDLETKNNREELFKGALTGEDKRDVNEKAT